MEVVNAFAPPNRAPISTFYGLWASYAFGFVLWRCLFYFSVCGFVVIRVDRLDLLLFLILVSGERSGLQNRVKMVKFTRRVLRRKYSSG